MLLPSVVDEFFDSVLEITAVTTFPFDAPKRNGEHKNNPARENMNACMCKPTLEQGVS